MRHALPQNEEAKPTRRTVAILTTLLLAAPVATATWRAHGTFEPDTPQDAEDGFMWADPDTAAGASRVYFNAFANYASTFVNPNVGAAQTRVLVDGFNAHAAFLGIWKDCNKDGYIGMAESVITEYRSELLPTTDVCPTGTEHNRAGWVFEFLWIGPGDNTLTGETARAKRLVDDRNAFVWGDPGLPGERISSGCFVNPTTGTFSSTGAFLAWADCNFDHGVARMISENDPTGALSFGDEPSDWEYPQCSSSVLNQQAQVFADDPRCPREGPGAWEDGPDPAATVFDCGSGESIVVKDGSGQIPTGVSDPTGTTEGVSVVDGDGNLASARIPAASPSVSDPRGSWYATANATTRGLTGCADWTVAGATVGQAGVAHFTPESQVTAGTVKRETRFYFWFLNDFGREMGFDQFDPYSPFGLGDPEMPTHAGVGYLNNGNNLQGPSWASPILLTDSVILRGDLQPAGAAWYTYYARVGDVLATVTLPSAAVGVYGAEWCHGATTGIVDGFDCDASRWWKEEHGASAMATQPWSGQPIGQTPGVAYQLRDVDCYDGTILGPAKAGLGAVSEEGVCPDVE